MKDTRVPYLDILRAVAVIWMIIFHATYDMRMFNYNHIDFGDGFWYAFPRVIAGTFLFCVGIALNYTHAGKVSTKAIIKRLKKLGLAALAVSIGTYFFNQSQWVFFGTLHCILAGSLLGAFFVHRRRAALIVMLMIMVLQYVVGFDIKWVSSIIQKPSMDFIPIYPWFWVVLMGILVGPYLSRSAILMRMKTPKFFDFLGRHSLAIYLLHQPLLFGALFLYQYLTKR
ncbi:MAG: heparan-alpha-glucosaminide N-acetyltransferase [Bacteriovoracaceae bacterium]